MSALEARIDELYALPPGEFTASRNALAKTLKGDEAARVKHLEKPAVVPWTVNQLYWRERRTYDGLVAAGHALRAAQIAALSGGTSDLRSATTNHRRALAAALATASQLAAQSGVRAASEPLSRMLEALSLSHEPPVAPGRFTEVLQPAGFEALAGVSPVARPPGPAPSRPTHPPDRPGHVHPKPVPKVDAAAERHRREAAARKAADDALAEATRRLEEARAAEARAQALVDVSRQQLERAEAAQKKTRTELERATDTFRQAEAARKPL